MQEPKAKKPAYTPSEKLLADMIDTALDDITEALTHMRQQGWHHSQDQQLHGIEHAVRNILYGSKTLSKCIHAVMNGDEISETVRLPAWNGYPQTESDLPKGGNQK